MCKSKGFPWINIVVSTILSGTYRYFCESEDSPVTSRKQRVFGLERDVEGEGEQRGVDGPRTVDRHLWTDISKTLLSNLLKYLVTKQLTSTITMSN